MFMNLGPLAKALHGVINDHPNQKGARRKKRSSRLWTQSLDDQDALPSEHEACPQQATV